MVKSFDTVTIVLRNTTGSRSGNIVRYEYGEDLFGYIYLDIVRQKKHSGKLARKMVFSNVREFVCTLDIDLYNKENLNYIPA